MRRHLIWLLPAVLVVACRRGSEGPAGPQGPAGPNYVSPNQQGYIRGVIIAQDTFNNQRARESYNHIYYTQSPCDVYFLGPSILRLYIRRSNEPYYATSSSTVSLQIDTSTSPSTVIEVSAYISHTKQVGNMILAYYNSFSTNDPQDTLLVDTLGFSLSFTQVRGRLRGIQRSVTPPDTVTFEFESVIPRQYQ